MRNPLAELRLHRKRKAVLRGRAGTKRKVQSCAGVGPTSADRSRCAGKTRACNQTSLCIASLQRLQRVQAALDAASIDGAGAAADRPIVAVDLAAGGGACGA